MTVHIQQAALLMTVQDGGRRGYQRFGMPESGPMDGWAFRCANRLVGNDPETACVEVGFSSAELHLTGRSLLGVCGAGYRLFVNEHPLPLWMAFLGKLGDRIRLEKTSGGSWVYLAAAGGIQSAVWMGSRSAYPAAGLEGQLADGDRLSLLGWAGEWAGMAGRSIPVSARPAYSSDPLIRVMPGPHLARFQNESWEILCEGPYSVSPQSDRMGYRLSGPPLAHRDGPDLVSQGMVLGEVQVPGDGQPIVMMPDHPTTGGYACIAAVARVDLPLLAQVEPGVGQLRFQAIDIVEAQSAWAEAVGRMDTAEYFEEDSWTGC
jgi:antagonist of KipI